MMRGGRWYCDNRPLPTIWLKSAASRATLVPSSHQTSVIDIKVGGAVEQVVGMRGYGPRRRAEQVVGTQGYGRLAHSVRSLAGSAQRSSKLPALLSGTWTSASSWNGSWFRQWK